MPVEYEKKKELNSVGNLQRGLQGKYTPVNVMQNINF